MVDQSLLRWCHVGYALQLRHLLHSLSCGSSIVHMSGLRARTSVIHTRHSCHGSRAHHSNPVITWSVLDTFPYGGQRLSRYDLGRLQKAACTIGAVWFSRQTMTMGHDGRIAEGNFLSRVKGHRLVRAMTLLLRDGQQADGRKKGRKRERRKEGGRQPKGCTS